MRDPRPALALHVFEGYTPQTVLAARRRGIPIVLDVPIVIIPPSDSANKGDHEIWARRLEERQAATVCLAGSEQVRAHLVEFGIPHTKVRLVPYGVNIDHFQPSANVPSTVTRLLFVGGDGRRKGLETLLLAAQEFGAALNLTIVGAHDAASSALRTRFPQYSWIGTVAKSDVARFFQQADAFVLPTTQEGSALAVLEAMAAGVPVITTKASGAPGRAGEHYAEVPVGDVTALRDAIALLQESPLSSQAMAERALALVREQFTWTNYAERLQEVYSELISL